MQHIIDKLNLLQNELKKNGYIENSERVKQKIKDFNDPFMLMIIGEGNYGKSTLINSLFNKQVAPTSRLPKTWKIDIFENSNNEEAILFFKNESNPRTVSIEQAKIICDEEEKKVKGNNDWKSDLYQVKWRYKTDWNENILLIDTPGFSQFRADNQYTNFNLFGTKGIQLKPFDGFEHYFFRADFVFWCIKATKLQDADTLSAIKNVSSNKSNIIGILTFMERIPIDRWEEILKEALKIYGEYITEFFFFSPQNLNNSIDKIRNFINSEINTKLKDLKNSSLLNYYKEELFNYSNSISKISDIYEKNISNYVCLIETLQNNFLNIKRIVQENVENTYKTFIANIDDKIYSIYYKAYQNPKIFQQLIEKKILNKYSIQEQINGVFNSLKDEITAQNIFFSRKLSWETIVISSRPNMQNTNLIPFKSNEIMVSSFDNHNLRFDYLFNDDINPFSTLIEGIFTLNPIMVITSLFESISWVFNFLFGETKEQRIIRGTREKLIDFFVKLKNDVKSKLFEISDNALKNLEKKINDSFYEYNGDSKNNIIRKIYLTDSLLSNQLQLYPDGQYIDCLNKNNQFLTYYFKLLKYDDDNKNLWNQNAIEIFNSEVSKIFNTLYNFLENVEKNIKNLIDENKLSDLTLFDNQFSSLNDYLTFDFISNPLIQSKEFFEKLVDFNGNQIYKISSIYFNNLSKIKKLIADKKEYLQFLWDQKVIDLIWTACNEKVFNFLISENSKFSDSNITQYCQEKSKKTANLIYKQILRNSSIFESQFIVEIDSHNEIHTNLIPDFLSFNFSFLSVIENEMKNNNLLISLKTFSISKPDEFINDYLTNRMKEFINHLPPLISFNKTYKRLNALVVISFLPLSIIITNNYIYPIFTPNDINEQYIVEHYTISLLNAEFSQVIFSLIFLIIISIRILRRIKMKKDILKFINDIFLEYGSLLITQIKNNFRNRITLKNTFYK